MQLSYRNTASQLMLLIHQVSTTCSSITSLDSSGAALLAIRQCASTLFLFTKSDLKTVLIPATAFAVVSTYPHIELYQLFSAIFWIWVHLLQFCISNQMYSVQEDKMNKPWRPLPSGTISLSTALYLRWILVPLCLVLSATQGTLGTACVLSLATYVHNDIGLGEYWCNRNSLCAIGYWVFNHGAVTILSSGSNAMLSEGTSLAEAIIPLIICTTIHAQDFRDSEGDRIKGRSTLPILFPRGSRWLLFASILGWSVVLAERASGVHYATKVMYVFIGIFVGALFVLRGEGEQDQQSYDAYNIWLCASQAITLCL